MNRGQGSEVYKSPMKVVQALTILVWLGLAFLVGVLTSEPDVACSQQHARRIVEGETP